MMKMMREWKTGCAAFLGNAVYNAADKKLKSEYKGFLLALVMDFVLSLFIVVKMWPINSFGRLVWLLLLLFFAFAFSLCAADDIMTKIMTALVRKYRPYAQLYSRRKREKEMRKIARRAAGKRKEEKEREGQTNAKRKKVQRERAEWEKTQQERAEREKAQKERAEREKAQKEKAEREKAQKERAEREKTQREREERAKEEQRKQGQSAGQISSIQQARQLLHMKESFTKAELKKARNILMKKYHPDNKDGGDEELCKKINAAYDMLSKYAKAA